jgi:hypothetical protein
MEALQILADAAEDTMIRRYRECRASTIEVTVSCGRCGVPQLVRPHHGVHRFSLLCYRCRQRTVIVLPAGAQPETAI